MKEIFLTQNKVALVDDKDFDYLNQFKWYAERKGNTYYAARKIVVNGLKTSIRMHTVILNIKNGLICDHIDHNGLNNQRNNIRICTNRQNSMNKSSSGISKYLGVSPSNIDKKPWRAFIKINGKSTSLGYFKTEKDAAKIYNEAAKEHFKEFANLNILEPLKQHSNILEPQL